MSERPARIRYSILLAAVGIFLIAVAITLIVFFSRNAEPNLTYTVTGPFPEIPRLKLKGAKSAYDSGEAVFLDVRGADSYASSHIPGAVSIPLSDLETQMGKLNPDDWIITYCT